MDDTSGQIFAADAACLFKLHCKQALFHPKDGCEISMFSKGPYQKTEMYIKWIRFFTSFRNKLVATQHLPQAQLSNVPLWYRFLNVPLKSEKPSAYKNDGANECLILMHGQESYLWYIGQCYQNRDPWK